MTKISEYPIITNPTEDDILIGTDVNSSDVTKNFSIGSIVNLANETIKPYKVYTALLTQTGINAPVATVLENTLGNVSFSYNSTGYYAIESDGLFIQDKTYFSGASSNYGSDSITLNFNYQDDSSIDLITFDVGAQISLDDALYLSPIEIRVYN
jgi:hypothetical protein